MASKKEKEMELRKILSEKNLTSIMTQYAKTKLENMDTILFYQLGDFYEFFFDDAVEMSKVLDLTLTGRECGLDARVPMCGIPYHLAKECIDKLLSLGYKVATCETSSTDPKEIIQISRYYPIS